MIKLEQFQEAKKRVDEVIIPTPLIYSEVFQKNAKIKYILNQKTYKELVLLKSEEHIIKL